MCCAKGKNQTHKDAIEFLTTAIRNGRSERSLMGTGMFIVPAPDLGILEWRELLVENLTIEETEKRGFNSEAFQWVPHELMSFHDIRSRPEPRCGGDCDDRPRCPIACWCTIAGNRCRRDP